MESTDAAVDVPNEKTEATDNPVEEKLDTTR